MAILWGIRWFGKAEDGRMLTYREFPKIYNRIRQYKIKLEKDVPSSLTLVGRDCWARTLWWPTVDLFKMSEDWIRSKRLYCDQVLQMLRRGAHCTRLQGDNWVLHLWKRCQMCNQDCIEVETRMYRVGIREKYSTQADSYFKGNHLKMLQIIDMLFYGVRSAVRSKISNCMLVSTVTKLLSIGTISSTICAPNIL